jgi:hypothetical protein
MFLSERIELTERDNQLGVRIGPRRNVGLWAFLSVWLAFWTLGGIAAIAGIATGHKDRLFISVWLVGWLFGEVVATLVWFWNGFGVETILVNSDAFNHRRSLFGRTITRRTIPNSEIVAIQPYGPFGFSWVSWHGGRHMSFTSGKITVNYQWQNFEIGYELEEDEAGRLADVLNTLLATANPT